MNLKILIIDDEQKLEDIFRTFLAKVSTEIKFCDHPQKAWQEIDKQHFDLIISDLKMPVIEGDEFIKIIRSSKHNSLTPIILCSGHMDKKVLSELTRESKVYFLNKPFDSKSLLELIEKTQNKVIPKSTEINLEKCQEIVTKLSKLVQFKKINEFESDKIWNYDSVLIDFSLFDNNVNQNITLLMQIKTFLSVASKIQGTYYKDFDSEIYNIWDTLINREFTNISKLNFYKVRGLEFLNLEKDKIFLKNISNEFDEIIIIIK